MFLGKSGWLIGGALVLALGCGGPDAIDATGNYGITEGSLTVDIDPTIDIDPTDNMMTVAPRGKNVCLNRKFVYAYGWGPTISLQVEGACDFAAQMDDDGTFKTRSRLCTLYDTDVNGKYQACFPETKGTAKDGKISLNVDGIVLLSTVLVPDPDGRSCMTKVDCEPDPTVMTNLWDCKPASPGAPRQCWQKIVPDAERACDEQDVALVVGAAKLEVSGQAGLSFKPDCNLDNIDEFQPTQCQTDRDCEAGTCQMGMCTPPAQPEGFTGRIDKCARAEPTCGLKKTTTCDSIERPGTRPDVKQCPDHPDTACLPEITGQTCEDASECPSGKDCEADPDADPMDPAAGQKFCVDRYRCRVPTVPATDGCGCFADLQAHGASCVEFNTCSGGRR